MMLLNIKKGQICKSILAFTVLSLSAINSHAAGGTSRTQHTETAGEAELHEQSAQSEADARCEQDPMCSKTYVDGERPQEFGVQPIQMSQDGINALTEGGNISSPSTTTSVSSGSGTTTTTQAAEEDKPDDCDKVNSLEYNQCLLDAANKQIDRNKLCNGFSLFSWVKYATGMAPSCQTTNSIQYEAEKQQCQRNLSANNLMCNL